MVDRGFNDQYGARSLKRAIQTYIEDRICDLLVEDMSNAKERIVRFDVEDGELKATITPLQNNSLATSLQADKEKDSHTAMQDEDEDKVPLP